MVEWAALEMRYAGNGIGGSNPPPSAMKQKLPFWEFLFYGEKEGLQIRIGRGRETCSFPFRKLLKTESFERANEVSDVRFLHLPRL